MKKISLLFLASLCFNGAYSQDTKPNFNRWSIDVNAGINKSVRNFTPGYESSLVGLGSINLGARYMFNPYFGLGAKFGFDRFQDNKNSADFATNLGRFQLNGIVNVGNVLNFYQWTEKIGLLAHFGIGRGDFVESGFPLFLGKKDRIGTISFGLSPQVKIGNKWAVNFDASVVGVGRMHHSWDYKTTYGANDKGRDYGINAHYYTASVGVSYYIGKKESHADWSPNKFVSKSDLDLLKEDMAAMRAGMNDDDKDGVPNYLDQEPNSTEGMKVNSRGVVDPTINDGDSDGIADAYDLCPDEKGTFLASGCPDSDNDGTADKNDKCPETPGNVWNNGCPSGNGDNVVKMNPPLENLNFNVGSADLSSSDVKKLDRAAEVLKANPNYKLVIKGHTDNVGKYEFNQELSDKRALAGRDYLVKKGIDPMRIQTVGYGYNQPLNTNDSKSSRARNRRIELEVRN